MPNKLIIEIELAGRSLIAEGGIEATLTQLGFELASARLDADFVPQDVRFIDGNDHPYKVTVRVEPITRAEDVTWDYATAKRTGTTCSACHEKQVESPYGVTCRNGHGGADADPAG